MTPATVALCAFAAYALAYRFYARYLSQRVFALDATAITPAHALEDGVDYVPTRPAVLFGHHYASITGLAPMLGPAVAVIWGWAPAVIWVVLGAIFVGCVHDFAALALSLRTRGLSVGHIAGELLSPRARTLFHLVIFFGVALAMGVFVFVIARLFSLELAPGRPGYPQAVLPSGLLILISIAAGIALYRRKLPLLPVATVGFALELWTIDLGVRFPTMGLPAESWPAPATWCVLLLAYAFIASVAPVWILLQSRDFLNSLLLYLGLGLAFVGFFVGQPSFAAPALRLDPPGAPPLLPFVFIIVACGAASGFHALVSSGTTAKQIDREPDARPIGYGAMIGESLLGLLATLACTAGVASTDSWNHIYASWEGVQALPINLDAFITGTTGFLDHLGLPHDLSSALIAMVVVSFALTTLDSATRLLRFNIEEIGQSFRIPFSQNRYVSSLLACLVIAVFAFYEVEVKVGDVVKLQPAGLALWQLFGTTNQLLAGLTLVLATVYLKLRGRPTWPTLLPAAAVLATTLYAMVTNLLTLRDPLLLGTGVVLLLLGLGVLFEAALALWRGARPRTVDDASAPPHV